MISNLFSRSFIFVLLLSGIAFSQAQQTVTINLAAAVDGKQFNCSETYSGIGTTGSTMTVSDFRFYVQDVRLVDKKGKETSVSLANDGKFQSDRVALIDFEDGTGPCKNGTADLNTSIRGTVPKGKYVGIKFKIGVPQDLNHLDPSKASAPLNVTRMMWSWQSGYKFVRIDTKTTGRPNGYVLHLGSSDCKTDAATNVTICGHANRPEFSFAKFDLAKDVATIDLRSLFVGADVDTNQEKTASGCMSFDGDADCAPVFANLGLPFAVTAAREQSVFTIKRMPTTRASVSGQRR